MEVKAFKPVGVILVGGGVHNRVRQAGGFKIPWGDLQPDCSADQPVMGPG